MTDMLRRLDDIEARIAISELRSAYCWYTTRGERDLVVDLFADDCVFENHRADGEKPALALGKPALRAYLAKMAPGRRIPVVMNEILSISGDRASGTCVMQSFGGDPFCGHYVDEFVKVSGSWKFSVRRFFPYWPVFKPDESRRSP